MTVTVPSSAPDCWAAKRGQDQVRETNFKAEGAHWPLPGHSGYVLGVVTGLSGSVLSVPGPCVWVPWEEWVEPSGSVLK